MAESLRPMDNIIKVFIFLTDAAVKYAGAFIPVKFFQASQIFASKATSYSLHDVQLSCLTRKYLTWPKNFAGTNAPAYFTSASVTEIGLAPSLDILTAEPPASIRIRSLCSRVPPLKRNIRIKSMNTLGIHRLWIAT